MSISSLMTKHFKDKFSYMKQCYVRDKHYLIYSYKQYLSTEVMIVTLREMAPSSVLHSVWNACLIRGQETGIV